MPQPSNSLGEKHRWIFSALPVMSFVLMGLIAGALLSVLASAFQKRSHYGEILLVAALLIVPPFLFYNWAALRQGLNGLSVLLKNLCWYHWVWLLIYLSMQTWRKRALSEIKVAPVDSFAAARLIMVTVAGCILLYRMFTRRTDFLSSWLRGIPGLLMLFVLAVITSTIWSIYWQWTLYKGCEYAVDVALLAAVLVSIKNVEEFRRLFDWTWLWIAVVLVMCWGGAYFDPEVALSHNLETGGSATGPISVQLSGVFPDLSANRIGEYSAILCVVALVRLLPVRGVRRVIKTWYTWLFAASFVTMVFAQTRSATGGFLVALVLIFWLSGRFKHGVAIVVLGFVLIIATGFGPTLINYMKRGQSTEEMEGLTGRLEWWKYAWKKYSDAPLTGYGAYAAGRFLVMGSFGNNIASMHSDWVETLAGCGFWGIFPLLAVMATGWWYLMRFMLDPARTPEERQLCLEAIAVLTIASIRTIFSTDLTWHAPLQFWIPLGYAEYLRRRYAAERFFITAPAYIGHRYAG